MADYRGKSMDVNPGVLRTVMIHARDLDDVWHQAAFELIKGNGYVYKIDKGSYANIEWRLEFDHVVLNVENPGNRPIVPQTRVGVHPPTSEKWVYGTYLPKLVTPERSPKEDYTYGERNVAPTKSIEEAVEGSCILKEQYRGANQMEKIIENFKKYGYESNQEVIQIGSPLDLWFNDPPCLRKIFCRIRYDKLHFLTDWRSWDLWVGAPSNLAGLQIVKEDMAAQIGVEDGGMIADSQGLHMYTQYWEMIAQELDFPIEKWTARNVPEGGLKKIHDEYAQIKEKLAQEESN